MDVQHKSTANSTLYLIFAVFMVPLFFAVVLQVLNYSGGLQNKGEWIHNPIKLDEILMKPPHTQYTWSLLIPCDKDCLDNHQVQHGISTLGAKSDLVAIIPVSPDMVYNHHLSTLNNRYIYLATPQQELMMRYKKDSVLDIISDLKKLLKSVERRK